MTEAIATRIADALERQNEITERIMALHVQRDQTTDERWRESCAATDRARIKIDKLLQDQATIEAQAQAWMKHQEVRLAALAGQGEWREYCDHVQAILQAKEEKTNEGI